MELLLIKLVALIRPLASMQHLEALFAVLGLGLFAVLLAVLFAHGATHRTLRLSAVDGVIIAFAVWCLAISGIYYDRVQIGEVAKLLVPVLSYTIVKNVVQDPSQYRQLLIWAMVGFAIPVLASVALIVTGGGAHYTSYWTGVVRWQGAYVGSHNLGHSMTLFLMMIAVYLAVRRADVPPAGAAPPRRFSSNALLALLAASALWCLYMSQVRTAIVGLLIFLTIYLFCYNKKFFLIAASSFAVLTLATVPYWLPALLPEFAMSQRGMEVKTMELGSGRPMFWLSDLTIFLRLPIDQQLAGVGIGARRGEEAGEVLYGHNDWLELLTQTGFVGVGLFIVLQIVIFRKIRRMPGTERYAFLAMFVAVNVMMVLSNSYTWRIQVGHLYYMMLAFIEVRALAALEAPVPAAIAQDEPLRPLPKMSNVRTTGRMQYSNGSSK